MHTDDTRAVLQFYISHENHKRKGT